ncbi:hypothetical protein ADUPG1_013995 [Aduncisulcus paluster]|uniref:Uncharacterized protein n=1 Tax=Aduncisulcus paluster TaxID=2918883 RepID=A0ABQ5K574_9EUKA|nr:hypothetical protein ADUPG1_013995 [Aduncisulcus paluster]
MYYPFHPHRHRDFNSAFYVLPKYIDEILDDSKDIDEEFEVLSHDEGISLVVSEGKIFEKSRSSFLQKHFDAKSHSYLPHIMCQIRVPMPDILSQTIVDFIKLMDANLIKFPFSSTAPISSYIKSLILWGIKRCNIASITSPSFFEAVEKIYYEHAGKEPSTLNDDGIPHNFVSQDDFYHLCSVYSKYSLQKARDYSSISKELFLHNYLLSGSLSHVFVNVWKHRIHRSAIDVASTSSDFKSRESLVIPPKCNIPNQTSIELHALSSLSQHLSVRPDTLVKYVFASSEKHSTEKQQFSLKSHSPTPISTNARFVELIAPFSVYPFFHELISMCKYLQFSYFLCKDSFSATSYLSSVSSPKTHRMSLKESHGKRRTCFTPFLSIPIEMCMITNGQYYTFPIATSPLNSSSHCHRYDKDEEEASISKEDETDVFRVDSDKWRCQLSSMIQPDTKFEHFSGSIVDARGNTHSHSHSYPYIHQYIADVDPCLVYNIRKVSFEEISRFVSREKSEEGAFTTFRQPDDLIDKYVSGERKSIHEKSSQSLVESMPDWCEDSVLLSLSHAPGCSFPHVTVYHSDTVTVSSKPFTIIIPFNSLLVVTIEGRSLIDSHPTGQSDKGGVSAPIKSISKGYKGDQQQQQESRHHAGPFTYVGKME